MCASNANCCLLQELRNAKRRQTVLDAGQWRKPISTHDILKPHILIHVCCLLPALVTLGRHRIRGVSLHRQLLTVLLWGRS